MSKGVSISDTPYFYAKTTVILHKYKYHVLSKTEKLQKNSNFPKIFA